MSTMNLRDVSHVLWPLTLTPRMSMFMFFLRFVWIDLHYLSLTRIELVCYRTQAFMPLYWLTFIRRLFSARVYSLCSCIVFFCVLYWLPFHSSPLHSCRTRAYRIKILSEACRILRPGGSLSIMEMDPSSPGYVKLRSNPVMNPHSCEYLTSFVFVFCLLPWYSRVVCLKAMLHSDSLLWLFRVGVAIIVGVITSDIYYLIFNIWCFFLCFLYSWLVL